MNKWDKGAKGTNPASLAKNENPVFSLEEKVDLGYIPIPNPDVVLQRDEGGRGVLVNLDTGNALSFDKVGLYIWETADGNISVAGIIEKIKQDFLSVPDDISADVTQIVRILKENGFFGSEIWRT